VDAADGASVVLLCAQRVVLLRCDAVFRYQVIGTNALGADPLSMLTVCEPGAIQALPAALGRGAGTGHEGRQIASVLHRGHLASASVVGSISVTASKVRGRYDTFCRGDGDGQ
jgi:hypothetical protein